MGLLQKLSETGLDSTNENKPALDKPVVQKKSNSVGLFRKSLMASENRRLDFFEFTGKYNLKICAVLKNQDGSYRINSCIGFDGKSVCLSASSADFWDGTISQINKLYSFDAASSDALPFFQFFSNELKEKINSIQIIKTQNNSIFFLCNNSLNEDSNLIADLEAVENTPIAFGSKNAAANNSDFAQIFEINFSEALESFVLSNSKHDVQFSKVILNELYYNMCQNFQQPDKLDYSEDGKFILYVKNELPVELLYNHLKIECSFVLANHSELINVTECQNNLKAEN